MNKVAKRTAARCWWKSEGGASAAEFALILPLLTVLLFGFFEMGRLFWSYNIVSAAVRDGGRFAARLPMTCGGLSATDLTRVQRLTRTGDVDGGLTPLLNGWTTDSSVSVTVACLDNASATYAGRYDGVAQIPTVQVTANAPYTTLFNDLLPLTIDEISVTHSEVWTE